MKIRVAEQDDVETLFELNNESCRKLSSREEIATLDLTPESASKR